MKKIITISFSIILTLFAENTFSQTVGQTIKGTVIDKQSQLPIMGATILIMGSEPIQSTNTETNGLFQIKNVLAGRYDILITYTGYKEIMMSNIVVTSGKEVSLDISMEENVTNLSEVVVTGVKKNETVNTMTSVSARSFSTEEVNRYAGGRADPSRLAANFAGVSSPDDSRNDLVIRGNSPTGVLWRIEGLNIPNPNHFSTIGTTGGPVSGINTNLLKNSDFFTSAFPSEYGNANAGVFDLGFRKGNSDKREHTFQLGAFTGIEGVTEGPINKEKGSSYVIAYRYSFTGVAQAVGIPIGTAATPFYQDISFKFNGGNTKLGKFVLFGLGGVSHIDFLHTKIDSTDLFANPGRDSYFKSKLGLIGISHFIRLNEKSYFKTVIGTTMSGSNYIEDSITKTDHSVTRVIENTTTQLRHSINTSFNSKINSKLFIKIGIIEELLNLNLFYRSRSFTPDWVQIWDYNDYTSLIQGYTHVKYSFSNRLTLNAGLHSQYLALNNSTSLEPRIGLKFQTTEKSTISLGYGMHSQMQPTDVYFFRTQQDDGSYAQTNKNLDFTRSMHYVIGYELFPLKDWRIKAEVYYQNLYNVPVTETPSSYTMLNAGASFFPNETGHLTNTGTGTNYGAELTIEKFFSKGYYGLATGSIYQSKYKGSDHVEYNTGFNGNYVYNILIGKEFKIGKGKQNRLSFDLKMTQAGGRYFTPVDLEASQAAGFQVLKGDEYAYSERNPDFYRIDFKIGYVINNKLHKISQTISIDIQNVTNHKNVFAQRYNPLTNAMNTAYQLPFLPNFVYKIQF